MWTTHVVFITESAKLTFLDDWLDKVKVFPGEVLLIPEATGIFTFKYHRADIRSDWATGYRTFQILSSNFGGVPGHYARKVPELVRLPLVIFFSLGILVKETVFLTRFLGRSLIKLLRRLTSPSVECIRCGVPKRRPLFGAVPGPQDKLGLSSDRFPTLFSSVSVITTMIVTRLFKTPLLVRDSKYKQETVLFRVSGNSQVPKFIVLRDQMTPY